MRHRAQLIPVLIFLASFAFTYAIEKVYDQYHILAQYNTLFDADPNDYTDAFANGWGVVSFRHPFSHTIFALPVRMASMVVASFGGNEMEIRREVALLITPLFEGTKNLILYLVLVNLGFNSVRAIVICCVNLFALCTVTVGSVPESFPISSMMVVLFAWFMTRDFTADRRVPLWQWITAGSFAIGITITNVFPLFVFFILGRMRGYGDRWWRGLCLSTVAAAACLVLAFAVAAPLCLAFSYTPKLLLPSGVRGDLGILGGAKVGAVLKGMDDPNRRPVEELIVAVVNTFIGVVKPQVVPNEHYLENTVPESKKPKLDNRFTYAPTRLDSMLSIAWALIFAGMLLLGGSKAYLQSPVWRALALGSAALIAFNLVLHQFFYSLDMFLYSLHWQVPMLFLLAGLAFIERRRIYGFVALALLACGSVITNLQLIVNIIHL
ncbi:MAG TPA: DUF6080 domain-containing protein [Blastocatellia bacterium]|nr:DUF6080 domain-containing protein [Blastocatellia bacterium]